MSDIAIKVEDLSKRYRIGLREEMHPSARLRAGYTFAGALTDFVTRPVKNLRRLRRLSSFEDERRATKDERRRTGNNPSSFVIGRSSSGEASDIIWALRDVSFEACPEPVEGSSAAKWWASLRQAQDRHRPQRGGEEQAAQDPLPHHRAHGGPGGGVRPGGQPAGGLP